MKHLIIWLSAGRAFCTRNINAFNTAKDLLIWLIVSLTIVRVLSTLNHGTLNAIFLALSVVLFVLAILFRPLITLTLLLTRKRT